MRTPFRIRVTHRSGKYRHKLYEGSSRDGLLAPELCGKVTTRVVTFVLQRVLRVECSTCNWSVLRECGQEPLQFYWFWAAICFFNSILNSNSELVRKVLKTARALNAAPVAKCWTAEILEPFNGLEKHEQYTQAVLIGTDLIDLKNLPNLHESVMTILYMHTYSSLPDTPLKPTAIPRCVPRSQMLSDPSRTTSAFFVIY
eukprot:408777-Pelagomonas_calceolata.AAC.3